MNKIWCFSSWRSRCCSVGRLEQCTAADRTHDSERAEREKHFANMLRDESVYASNEMDFVIFFGCFAIFNIAQLIYGPAIFL